MQVFRVRVRRFDWNSIKELEITEKKLFLAGGLNSGNVAAAVKCVQLMLSI